MGYKMIKIGNENFTKELFEEKKKGKEDYTITFRKIPNCPGKHHLTLFNTSDSKYYCDKCKTKKNKNSKMYGCEICGYDLCVSCFGCDGAKEKSNGNNEDNPANP